MNTTESIVTQLQTELDEHIAAGRFTNEKACRQQINAHETLARLRAEFDANPSAGVAAHIEFWRRNVNVDVDPPAKPKRGKAAAHDDPPGDA